MKKLVSLLCIISMLSMALVGCGSKNGSDSKKSGSAEIALITATGSIDDKSFNQGAWEGLKQYADENGKTYKYYKPTDSSETAIENAIELSVAGGAKVVVCPGYLFSVPLFNLQDKYPDVTFIQLDGTPADANGNEKIGNNVVACSYAEDQAGFLAGYAAVQDGYRKLGFMGGIAMPAVVRFGYGFAQGAEFAAKELGLKKDEVVLNYNYTGNFDATPDNMAKAASWYSNGTEVIFACGGSVGNSVMSAAENNNGKVVGVDIDQASESNTVITSAMKNISKSVYDYLVEYYNGTLKTGTSAVLDATTNSVLLPAETSKFSTFTQEQYDAIYKELVDGKVTIKADKDAKTASDLGLDLVKVTVIE
ncbi:MAG: BMP family ABC transporter substrate-binding protein [bacterium]|nr:BMP family ABC transporter substrate-binding protein [bacterium]